MLVEYYLCLSLSLHGQSSLQPPFLTRYTYRLLLTFPGEEPAIVEISSTLLQVIH